LVVHRLVCGRRPDLEPTGGARHPKNEGAVSDRVSLRVRYLDMRGSHTRADNWVKLVRGTDKT
jgi:hypothetical protein